ncbi:hypothetical protein FPZ49_13670 [Paenibacillus cremeus]|uniref:Uncharacterized protein n=2 Tax=Paenibacillus cremeus TaxID=2163881 RepID=A0A559KBK8_9BACL|nr:hypothetical protein FPZ49_13670 [Paenibacillus cremeus]
MHPVYHYFLSLMVLLSLVSVVVYIVKEGFGLTSVLFLFIVLFMLVTFILLRSYPLKAQDRAIRAEENLRHYVLSGKLLDSKLSMGQITALRFAGDAELPELSKRAAEQNLSPEDIKKAIKQWRGDTYRV